MSMQIDAKPMAHFSQPVDLLINYHRRVERFLQKLARIVTKIRDQFFDAAHRVALQTALACFRSAASRPPVIIALRLI